MFEGESYEDATEVIVICSGGFELPVPADFVGVEVPVEELPYSDPCLDCTLYEDCDACWYRENVASL